MTSIPEPKPENKGIEVYPIIKLELEKLPDSVEKREILTLLSKRREFGLNKYGQTLMSDDGRNTTEDAEQELGDFLMYFEKLKIRIDNKQESADKLTRLSKLLKFTTEFVISREMGCEGKLTFLPTTFFDKIPDSSISKTFDPLTGFSG